MPAFTVPWLVICFLSFQQFCSIVLAMTGGRHALATGSPLMRLKASCAAQRFIFMQVR